MTFFDNSLTKFDNYKIFMTFVDIYGRFWHFFDILNPVVNRFIHSWCVFQAIKLDSIQSIFSCQGSVLLACQSQREGIFREYFGGLQRGRGRRGFNNIYTLNMVRSKCFLFVANSTLRLIQFNIIVPLALILTELEETFTKEYISDFLVCTKSCTQPYIT